MYRLTASSIAPFLGGLLLLPCVLGCLLTARVSKAAPRAPACVPLAQVLRPTSTGSGEQDTDTSPVQLRWKGTASRRIANVGSDPFWMYNGKAIVVKAGGALESTESGCEGISGLTWASDLWLLATDKRGEPKKLAALGDYAAPSTLDKNAVIYIGWGGREVGLEAYCIDADGNRTHELAVNWERPTSTAAADPRCTYVAFTYDDSMFVVPWGDSQVGAEAAIDAGPTDVCSEPCWSRDGTLVAWAHDKSVYIYAPATGKTEIIRTAPYHVFEFPRPTSWSADGRYIAGIARVDAQSLHGGMTMAMGRYEGVGVLDTATKTLRVIRPQGPAGFHSPAWSSRGTTLAFSDEAGGIHIRDFGGDTEQHFPAIQALPIERPGEISSHGPDLDWSPDDGSLVVAMPGKGVYVIDLPQFNRAETKRHRSRMTHTDDE